MFTTLFHGSSRALKAVDFIRVSSGGFTGLEWWTSHPRFAMQGHILNIGGDALIHVGFGIKSIVYWVCSWYLLLCGYVLFTIESPGVFFLLKKSQSNHWLPDKKFKYNLLVCIAVNHVRGSKFWSQFEFWNFAWVWSKTHFGMKRPLPLPVSKWR